MQTKKLFFLMFIIPLCLSNIAEAQQTRIWEYEVAVYPAEVYFGDPVYVGIYFKNTREEVVRREVDGEYHFDRRYHWLTLRSYNISVPYYLLHEGDWSSSGCRDDRLILNLQLRVSVLCLVAYQELPALEDMDFPFWKEARERLKSGKNISAHITLEAPRNKTTGTFSFAILPNLDDTVFMSNPIRIKPRPAMETEMLERWLAGTPEEILPVPIFNFYEFLGKHGRMPEKFEAIPLPSKPNLEERGFKIYRNLYPSFSSNKHFIKVKGRDYFPAVFLRSENRKPGDPVCPTTWQGWKELEESLVPSTMRDEIRLTRMLIQYCDTEDEAILEELKDWFCNMNNIQRTSMAESLIRRGPADLKYLAQKFYKTIHEFNGIPIHEYDAKRMREQGWIE